VPWWIVIVVGLLIWAAVTLLVDAWIKREGRPTLADRLAPFQYRHIGDEAEDWLEARER
jgi:hypothetical protein